MASIPRLYVSHDLIADGEITLDEAQSKYLTRVMRLGLGAPVHVFNGRDGEWDMEISAVETRSATLRAGECRREQINSRDLTLLFAPLKKTRTDFVIEKATELGAGAIRPVMTARTTASRVRADRLEKIAIEAAEQSERLDLPRVHEAQSLERALAGLMPGTQTFFCDEAGGAALPMREALGASGDGPGALLVGPEGGFTPGEREFLLGSAGIVPVTLGPRILRAETAVVAAITLWQAVLGDWR